MDQNDTTSSKGVEGQLNARERTFITDTIINARVKPRVALEIGTWLGGGSTLHILRALQANGEGHLWGIEASKDIYEKMVANIRIGAPKAADRFTPLLGFSHDVLPSWLNSLPPDEEIDFIFLDGGDNPSEQVEEFKLLASRVRVGGTLAAHDARMRKGKWLAPYVGLLDNWESGIKDMSIEGVFVAHKLQAEPSPASLQAAERKLKSMQWELQELAARFLPKWFCGLVLGLLPRHLMRRLTLGANVARIDNPSDAR